MVSRSSFAAAAAALLVVACSVTPAPGAAAAEPESWKATMEQVDRLFDIVEAELGVNPPRDLRAAADAAHGAAGLMRHGYGKFRNPRIENFDRMARDAESWLLRIAAEAGQGNGTIAQDLFRGGEQRHCKRCHDAAEKVQW